MAQATTRTVTVLSAGFSDHSDASLVLEEGDIWEEHANGDVFIHIQPRDEKTLQSPRGPIKVKATPQRTIRWRAAHIIWTEWNTAEVPNDVLAYVPPKETAEA